MPLPPPGRGSRSRQRAGPGRAGAERAGRPPEPPPVAQALVGARPGRASGLRLRFGGAVGSLARKAKASACAVGACALGMRLCARAWACACSCVCMCRVSLCDRRDPSRSQSFLSPVTPRPDIPCGRLPTSSKSQDLSSGAPFNCLPAAASLASRGAAPSDSHSLPLPCCIISPLKSLLPLNLVHLVHPIRPPLSSPVPSPPALVLSLPPAAFSPSPRALAGRSLTP